MTLPQSRATPSTPHNWFALLINLDGSMRCGAPFSWTKTLIFRVLLDKQTRCAGVIQVDVRDEERFDVTHPDPLRLEQRPERVDARPRSGIDQHNRVAP